MRIGVEEMAAMAKSEDGERKESYKSLKLTYKRKAKKISEEAEGCLRAFLILLAKAGDKSGVTATVTQTA
jgi:hypothetical protein